MKRIRHIWAEPPSHRCTVCGVDWSDRNAYDGFCYPPPQQPDSWPQIVDDDDGNARNEKGELE